MYQFKFVLGCKISSSSGDTQKERYLIFIRIVSLQYNQAGIQPDWKEYFEAVIK